MDLFRSYAKINLGLNILSKREDNYHNIETIFQRISLHDELVFEESDTFSIESDSIYCPTDNSNLIWKTKDLLEKNFNININEKVTIKKQIPVFAGLGGGSSDAASSLLYFYKKYLSNVSFSEIEKISLQLGSDVPFFLRNVTCFSQGRGEILTELVEFNFDKFIVVVFPDIRISTAEAYANIRPKSPEFSLANVKNIGHFISNMKFIKNDFEDYVFNKYPVIGSICDELINSGSFYSSLSGSGSAVYGLFDKSCEPDNLKFKFKGFKVFVCQSI